MRHFASVIAGILMLVGVFFCAYAARSFAVAADESERALAFALLDYGFSGIAGSAIVGTLGAILGALEDRG